MKSFLLKLVSLILGIGISAFLAIPLTQAQENPEETPGPTQCLNGYRQFLSSTLGYEGLEDYWLDIFSRSSNPCYYRDIRSIEERLRRARQLVRSTFLRCDLRQLDNTTEAYHRLEAELYFLRHAVSKNDEGIFVINRLANEKQREELMKEMRNFFVIDRKLITEEQMVNYLSIFEAKYRNRIDDYNSCRSDIYGDIETKFKEFWEQIKALGGEFKNAFKEETSPREDARAPGASQASQTGLQAVLQRVEEIVDFIEIEPEQDLEDLSHRLNPADALPTFENVQRSLERAAEVHETSTSRALLLGKYEGLYGHVSDDAIQRLVSSQDRLIQILKDTEPEMEAAGKCLRNTENKECQNAQ